jgi:hypothetical protein
MATELPLIDHAPTSEELRLRVIARTNGENMPASHRAMTRLASMAYRRKVEADRRIDHHQEHPPGGHL